MLVEEFPLRRRQDIAVIQREDFVLNTASLVLIPLLSSGFSEPVCAAAGALGYRIRILPPEDLGVRIRRSWPDAVLFLLGSSRDWKDRILAMTNLVGPLPTLALLVNGQSQWNRRLLECFCDCAEWPCSGDELAFRLERLCQAQTCETEWLPELGDRLAELNLIGRSPAFLNAIARIRRMAPYDAPVLILGETGTGKELAARAFHYFGPRAGGPFLPVNCGALPDDLVENELFGHERGAYTDAKASALGAVGEASGGTLFLDEVEALSPKAQVALLRFLQDREYRPLGSGRVRCADTRIIAASNADLRGLTTRGRFRADLFYRLNILSLRMPPLCERGEDVEHLVRHFLARYCRQYGLEPKSIDAATLRQLRHYPWPGNVRELENLIHREVLLCQHRVLRFSPEPDWSQRPLETPALDESASTAALGFAEAKAQAIQRFEHSYLTRLMIETDGNVTQAARRAGKERRSLGKLLKKHSITTGKGSG